MSNNQYNPINEWNQLNEKYFGLFGKEKTAEEIRDEKLNKIVKKDIKNSELLVRNAIKQKGKIPGFDIYSVWIGDNFVKFINNNLLSEMFENKNGKWVDIYDYNTDKLNIKWLRDGRYTAESISLNREGGIVFNGIWEGGNFEGIFSSGKINGGTFDGIAYMAGNSNFHIKPEKFIKGKWMSTDGILGKPFVILNKNLNQFYIFQVPSGKFIEFIKGNNNIVTLEIIKTIDRNGTDIILKNINTNKEITLNWNIIRNNLDNYEIKLHESFLIPELIDIDVIRQVKVIEGNLVQQIQQPNIVQQQTVGIKPFIINYLGLKTTAYIEILTQKELDEYNKFTSDIQSGEFIIKLKQFKKLISSGEVDGFGNYPTLKYFFPTQGINFKNLTKEDRIILQYFVDLKRNIIDSFVLKNGKENNQLKTTYIEQLKEFLGLTENKKSSEKKSISTPYISSLKENKLSFKNILAKIV